MKGAVKCETWWKFVVVNRSDVDGLCHLMERFALPRDRILLMLEGGFQERYVSFFGATYPVRSAGLCDAGRDGAAECRHADRGDHAADRFHELPGAVI